MDLTLEGKSKPLRFFVVEDSESDAALLERTLRREWAEAEVEILREGSDFKSRVSSIDADVIICDFNLPGLDAWSALRDVRDVFPEIPFLVFSGAVGEERAVDLIKSGVADVILKSQPGRLVPSIRRALKERDANIREKEASLRAEAAIRGREDTLAVVSHDLRNPLSTILLLSQIHVDRLTKSLSTSLPPEVLQRTQDTVLALSKIRRAAGFMRTLIEDVLILEDAARSELVITPTETRVEDFLRDLVEMFEPIAKDKDVTLVSRLDAVAPTALFDSDRLFQALSNVLSNAVKFSPRGGVILIRAATEPGVLKIEVMDSGEGVDPALQEKIFDKFFQGDPKFRSGLGLGLYIAQTIVKNHGGDITFFAGVAPDPVGACFRLTLPQPTAMTDKVSVGGANPDAAIARILFIDDDEDLREVIALELRRRGFFVEELENLGDAKEFISSEAQPLDLILVDYRLPDGKGTDLVAHLARFPAWKGVPVLLLSGEMNIGALAQVAGITSFIPKPPNMPELIRQLTQMAHSSPPLGQSS
ncbi:MAG: response regulator [Cryobacterium sp.]|nr:response regulator [Oligoflexia bacterium]